MKKLLPLAACLAFFMGCATVSFAPSKTGTTASVIATPDQIEVYRSEKPKTAYTEIGAINYPGGRNLESLLRKMKTEASKRGGNAIIDLQITADGAVGTIIKIEK